MSNDIHNACFLDGLTLQNATRVVQPTADTIIDRKKLLPIQLVCLAQLTEALVCYEKILTLPSHAHLWMKCVELRNAYDDGIIGFPNLSADIINQIERHSCRKLLEYARAPSFQHFIDTVVEQSIEGVVLKITRNYNNLKGHPYNHFFRNDLEVEIRGFIDEAHRIWTELRGSRLSQVITVLGTGALCYKDLAAVLGIPYSPFCLRAPVCIYDDIRYAKPPVASSHLALSLVKDQAREELDQVLPGDVASYIDLEIPFILSSGLSDSHSPNDIVRHAIGLRNTAKAREFRTLVSELAKSLYLGNGAEAIRIAKALKSQVQGVLRSDTIEPSAKVKVGIAGFSLEFPIPVPKQLRALFRVRRKSSFYYLLLSRLPSFSRFKTDIKRVFKVDLDLGEYERMLTYSNIISPKR